MPIVSEFIRLCRNFSTMTLMPGAGGELRLLPVVIGIVRTSLPLRNTRIWSVFMSTLLTIASPTWNFIVRSIWP